MKSLIIWERQIKGCSPIYGLGADHLLDAPSTAFFASRQCSGLAIRLAMNWALAQAEAKQCVISGFHSPLEQSVLTVLLQAKSPVIAVLARSVADAQLPAAWHEPLQQGRMAVISASQSSSRLTAVLASLRNELVAQVAQQIVVAQTSSGGALESACQNWKSQGKRLEMLI